MKAIILAAGIGKRLKEVTDDPKCLLKIGKITLLHRYLIALERMNILDVVMVVGYKKGMIMEHAQGINFKGRIKFIENPDFTKGSIISLWRVGDELKGEFLLMDADVYFEEEVLRRLVESPYKNLLIIDTSSKARGEEWMVGVKNGRIIATGREIEGKFDTIGEWVGFIKMDDQAGTILRSLVEKEIRDGNITIGYEDLLPSLFKEVDFKVESIAGLKWIEIDFPEDVFKAEED